MTTKKVRVNWDEVHDAFLFRSETQHAILDLETGNVVYTSDWEEYDEPGFITCDELNDNPERYIGIEPPQSWEAFKWMERFILNVDDERIRDALEDALSRQKPFRRFKDALDEFPGMPEKWYAFEEERLFEYIAEWAEGLRVEIENEPPWMKLSGDEGSQNERGGESDR